MSQPRYYWYGSVKKMIAESSKSNTIDTFQDFLMKKAIFEAKVETAKLPNGELRLKAIEEILIKCRQNYDSFAYENHYERRVIQRWCTSFVNMVGKKAGY